MKLRSSKIALGGVLASITLVILFIFSVIPGISSTVLIVSALPVGIMIKETDIKSGILLYAVTSILGAFIVPNKVLIFPYILFFGLLGLENYISNKQKNIVVKYIIKLAYYFIFGSIGVFGFGELVFGTFDLSQYSKYLILGAGLILFLAIDYIYTLGMNYYESKVVNRGRKDDFKLL